MKHKIPILAGIVCLMLGALRLAAAESFRWNARAEGEDLTVTLTVPKGGYVGADSVAISAANGELTPVEAPAAVPHDGGQIYPPGEHVWRFRGHPPFRIAAEFQGCLDGVCLMPQRVELAADGAPKAETPAPAVEKNRGDAAFALRAKHTGTATEEEFLAFLRGGKSAAAEAGRDASVWWMILIALVGGILLNFTPCVLPMIPVNLMIIQASGKGAWAGLRNGGCYALGMAAAYGGLGMLAVLGGARFGDLNSSYVFNFAVAGIFLVLALGAAGVFNIDFNRWHIDPAKLKLGTAVGAFLLGAVAALLAGACVAPVVLTVLVFSVERYQAGYRAALLLPLALGIGMGLPWPLAGMGLAKLPKPGKFMVYVKYGFAVLILVLAAYYVKVGIGLLPRKTEAGSYSPERELAKLDAALARARRERKPVLIDFWATWCGNCRHMEDRVLASPKVKAELENFVVVKFRAEDLKDPRVRELFDRWELPGLPSFVILEAKP